MNIPVVDPKECDSELGPPSAELVPSTSFTVFRKGHRLLLCGLNK
jgi:hypothetical protein